MKKLPSPKRYWLQWISEIMVVTAFTLVLGSLFMPYWATPADRLRSDARRQREVLRHLEIYATDHVGRFPHLDQNGEPFQSSTEAFQHLIDETGLPPEQFYSKRYEKTKRPPNANGILEPQENYMSYVSGQNTSMDSMSPIVSDEMVGPGVFGADYPSLKHRRVVTGRLGGYATIDKLTDNKSGAVPYTRDPVRGRILIFEPAEYDEDGKRIGGGFLAVPTENILHP